MKKTNLLLLALTALFLGLMPMEAWAERTTLAAWDFGTNVCYSGTTNEGVTYYTASEATKQNMEFTFSANKPYFYPTSGSQTTSTLNIWTTETSKKWYISDYNSGALRMYTATPTTVSNYMDPAQQNTYAELTFPATGYKNVQVSFKMSGNNGTNGGMVVVSTDDGATWMNVSSFTTGSSWSNFKETTVSLSVANCPKVIVRAVIGYKADANSDMYLNNFKVTAEPVTGSETWVTASVAADDAAHGYATISPAGGVYESGTTVTFQATGFTGYRFMGWNNGSTTIATANPHSFAVTENTALTAEFASNVIELPSASVLNPLLATISNDKGKTVESGGDIQFDSFTNGGTATFALNNTVADSYYKITLDAATALEGSSLRLVITDATTTNVELDKTISLTKGDNWQTFNSYTIVTNQMAEGLKDFVITFNGASYTANVKNILFTKLNAEDLCQLTMSASPANAGYVTVSPTSDFNTYMVGSQVTLTAMANTGWQFVEWQDELGNSLSTDNPYTFTLNATTNVVAKFEKAKIAEGTIIQLAKWDFNTGYDVEGNVYTPNTNAWEKIGSKYFSNAVPQILPNSHYDIPQTDYVCTGWVKDGNWQMCSGYNNEVFRIVNSTGNNISDITDGSQHDVYYEVSFPSKGFRNISIDYACAYGGNAAATMQVVASTDGGQTWTVAGQYTCANTWWTYNAGSVNLNANDKEQVIVRFIAGNDYASNWNLDYITVKGEKMPEVTITSAGYATYYNDHAVEIPANVTAYWGSLSSDGTKLEMTAITDGIIPANTGVVLKGAQNTYALETTNETGSTYSDNALRGVVAETSVSSLGLGAGTIYVLGLNHENKVAFCRFTGSALGDHRAYLFVSGGGARSIEFSFDDETTDVSERVRVNVEEFATAPVYNLSGQRVAQPTKGLYIVNGKKVIR